MRRSSLSALGRPLLRTGAALVACASLFAACSSSSTDTTPTGDAGQGGGGAGGVGGGTGGATAGGAGAAGKGGGAAGTGGSTAGNAGAGGSTAGNAGAGGSTAGNAGTGGASTGGGAGSGGGAMCGNIIPPANTAACMTCLSTKCCDEQIACTASPSCAACNVAANPGAAGGSGGSGGSDAAGMAGSGGSDAAGMGGSGGASAGAGGAAAGAGGGSAGSGGSGPDCLSDPEYSALQTCTLSNCAMECGIKLAVLDCAAPVAAPSKGACFNTKDKAIPCNPLAHTGCTAATAPTMMNPMPTPMPSIPTDLATGYACDGNVGSNNQPTFGLVCYAPPNTQTLCQPCGDALNKFCADGVRCIPTLKGPQCAAYCCNDADCSANGKCDTTLISDISSGMFGVCVAK